MIRENLRVPCRILFPIWALAVATVILTTPHQPWWWWVLTSVNGIGIAWLAA